MREVARSGRGNARHGYAQGMTARRDTHRLGMAGANSQKIPKEAHIRASPGLNGPISEYFGRDCLGPNRATPMARHDADHDPGGTPSDPVVLASATSGRARGARQETPPRPESQPTAARPCLPRTNVWGVVLAHRNRSGM